MKRYCILLTVFVVFSAQKALANGIQLPTGTFSTTSTGSLAVCLNPTTFQEVACTTRGAQAFPFTAVAIGSSTTDASGYHSCGSQVETDADFPLDTSPPIVQPNEHVVGTIKDYDPNTGTGDSTFVIYIGGHCHGAYFDSTGATRGATGASHFAVSEDGRRVDGVLTQVTNRLNSIGDFSLYTVNRQTR